MPTYEKASVVPVDFETVWDFYDDVDELASLTPTWVGLRSPRVIGPDGESAPDRYRVGTEIHLEIRPFDLDLLPAIQWTVEITERDVSETRAQFVDEQVGPHGPFERWRHVHQFADLGEETLVHDRITYRLPSAGRLPVAHPVLAAMLWHRHRRTEQLLAG